MTPFHETDSGQRALRRPIAVDLFAGAGGLSLGVEQAGFDVVASLEYDPVHCAVHTYNFPRTAHLCSDASVTRAESLRAAIHDGVEASQARTWDGELDLVVGGPPCQGFSLIGKRALDDVRNALVFEFRRLVLELQPRYFIMENVPGMVAGTHKTDVLERLVTDFQAGGYDVIEPPRILNAASFGVPQDRSRLFIIGARSGQPLPSYPTPTVQERERSTSHRRAARSGIFGAPDGPSVWDAIGDLPDADAFPELLASDEVSLSDAAIDQQLAAISPYAARLRGSVPDESDLSHPRRWRKSRLTSSMRTTHQATTLARFAITEPGRVEPVTRFHRLTVDGLSSTIRAGTGSERGAFTSPRPIHPTLDRVLTVREAARLHSFPDWFRFHSTKWHGFRQVGNAVPPILGRAVAWQIVSALNVSPRVQADAWELGNESLLQLDRVAAARYFGADLTRIPRPRARSSV